MQTQDSPDSKMMKLTKSELAHLEWLNGREADSIQVVVAGYKVHMMDKLYNKGLIGFRPNSKPYPRYMMVNAGREALAAALKQMNLRQARKAVKAIYVTQFGGWWKLTPEAWLDLCTKSVDAWENDTTFSWDMSEKGKRLASTPYHAVFIDRWTDKDDFVRCYAIPRNNTIRVYRMVCDWKEDEWREALKEIQEAMK